MSRFFAVIMLGMAALFVQEWQIGVALAVAAAVVGFPKTVIIINRRDEKANGGG